MFFCGFVEKLNLRRIIARTRKSFEMKSILIVLLALVACVLCTGPHLVAQKSIVGDAVENRNMTLEIRLWNLGQG